jgi:hypothetical protein
VKAAQNSVILLFAPLSYNMLLLWLVVIMRIQMTLIPGLVGLFGVGNSSHGFQPALPSVLLCNTVGNASHSSARGLAEIVRTWRDIALLHRIPQLSAPVPTFDVAMGRRLRR